VSPQASSAAPTSPSLGQTKRTVPVPICRRPRPLLHGDRQRLSHTALRGGLAVRDDAHAVHGRVTADTRPPHEEGAASDRGTATLPSHRKRLFLPKPFTFTDHQNTLLYKRCHLHLRTSQAATQREPSLQIKLTLERRTETYFPYPSNLAFRPVGAALPLACLCFAQSAKTC